MESESKKVTVEVSVNTEKAMKQSAELNELLKSANSLANELAETLKELKFNVEEKHNKRILLKRGFAYCAYCKGLIDKSDKYCSYCGRLRK